MIILYIILLYYVLFDIPSLFIAPSKTEVNVYPGQDVQTVVGKPLVIECIQNGLQKSHVTWFKVMKKLGTRTLVNRTRNSDLVFNSVQKSDAGEYCCRATDGEEKTVFVSVGGKKYFSLYLCAFSKFYATRS